MQAIPRIVQIALPERPPPLSACFTNHKQRGRVKTPRYRAWETLCAPTMQKVSEAEKFVGTVAVKYRFKRTDRRKRDLGNLEKAMSDILVKHGIIEDDSLIVDLHLAWGGDSQAEITIWNKTLVDT